MQFLFSQYLSVADQFGFYILYLFIFFINCFHFLSYFFSRASGLRGGLGIVQKKSKKGKIINVRALPLYAILKAINVPVIDYFSLDIEGVEMEVSEYFSI